MKVENLHKFTDLGCVNYLIVITFSLFLVHVHIVRAVQREWYPPLPICATPHYLNS